MSYGFACLATPDFSRETCDGAHLIVTFIASGRILVRYTLLQCLIMMFPLKASPTSGCMSMFLVFGKRIPQNG